MRRLLICLIAILSVWGLSYGELGVKPEALNVPKESAPGINLDRVGKTLGGLKGLLDPQRLSRSQSYSMGFYSGSGSSGMEGIYLNKMEYRASNALSFKMDVGFLYGSGSLFNRLSGSNEGKIVIPRMGFEYRPTSYFSIRMEYSNLPGRYYRYRDDLLDR